MNTFNCEVCGKPFESEKKKQVTCSPSCRGTRAGRGNRKGTVPERFWPKVRRASVEQCWLWIGKWNDAGYGLFYMFETGRDERAHRVSYELSVGPIAPGLELDHTCNNPPCVNPAHLEPVTHHENMLRMSRRGRHYLFGRTQCPNGHELTGNTRTVYRSTGKKETVCTICEEARRAKWRQTHERKSRAGIVTTPEEKAAHAKYMRERMRRIDADPEARQRRLERNRELRKLRSA